MNTKLFFIALFLLIIGKAECQKTIQIGSKVVTTELLDSVEFSFVGTWKVIYRTYVAEREHTFEITPLEQLNTKLYKLRKLQGELIYGTYVSISESLYIPYTAYLPKLILNPIYKKNYIDLVANDHESDPRWGNQTLLSIDVHCPSRANSEAEFSIFALTKNMIVIISNNSNTFLERVKNLDEMKNTWKKDLDGYYFMNLMGSSNIEFMVDNKDMNKKMELEYRPSSNTTFKYNYIENISSNTCNSNASEIIYTTRNKIIRYPLNIKIPLTNIKSNRININVGTVDQTMTWLVRWKIVNE